MLKCSKCGYKNSDDAKVCNLCSNKIDPSNSTFASAGKKGPPADAFMFEPRMLGGGINRRTQNLGSGMGGGVAGAVGMGGAPAPVAEPPKDRHFVVPPTGEPARIEAGTVYLIGREETCQIRITAPRVSRKHAEIKFDGGKPAVYDMGSQNGTLVNGMKLASKAHRLLADGDVIDVGGVTMTYRFLKAGESESKLKQSGGEATLVAAEPEEHGDLTGNVALMPIGDVLKRLESLHATGLLVVEAGGAKGAIRVEDGIAVAGSYAGLENAAAIGAVRSLAQGKFSFEMSDPDAPLAEVVVPEPPRKPATGRQGPPPPAPGARPGGPPPTKR